MEEHELSKATGDIFRDLQPHERDEIAHQIHTTSYPAGHILHAPGDYNEHVFILQSGRVQIYKKSLEGRILRINVLEPVSVFGEITLMNQWMYNCFAEAMTTCVIGTIERHTMHAILQTYPQVTIRFMELMGQRLHEMENKLVDIAFKSVPQRLATILINLASTSPPDTPTGPPPTVARYTHQQLAEMIGSYRETVTKIMGEFREEGLIRVEGEHIYLTNMSRLQQLMHG
jgi:CRP/FNR family transcriptional regulator, cyclic AMP receptor protein